VNWKRQLFLRKDLEMLLAEAAGEHRLHRVLGPVALTSLGVGCIIGAGIFVMTGRAAAQDAGPAVMISFGIAALGCAFAALCYAEFAAMAPVAGSAYTYAYTTLGEIFAWIIGWDLILEYAMGCATVASAWSGYLNEFLLFFDPRLQIPRQLLSDPFTPVEGLQGHPWFNLPSLLIMAVVTTILVLGIRESARTNALLVIIKVSVVVFVVVVGCAYVSRGNWTTVAVTRRVLPQDRVLPKLVKDYCQELVAPPHADALTRELATAHRVHWNPREVSDLYGAGQISPAVGKFLFDSTRMHNAFGLPQDDVDCASVEQMLPAAEVMGEVTPGMVRDYLKEQFEQVGRTEALIRNLDAAYRVRWARQEARRLEEAGRLSAAKAAEMVATVRHATAPDLPQTAVDQAVVAALLPEVRAEGAKEETEHWGILGLIGLNRWLVPIDDATRSPFTPYGLAGVMLGASIVFFAYIGFDSISTHAEEARHPQRDVPLGILISLLLCTLLYMAVAAVITGMIPYPNIDIKAPIAVAFREKAALEHSRTLHVASGLIAAGGLAGMTSVLLVLFLSQARIFMAMARDGLLPRVFGAVHPRFRTPHVATLVTGSVICVVAALTPIRELEEMVNVGTLLAFVMVCAAVLILRLQRPAVHRPFRCPLVRVVAPLGVLINLLLTLFLPLKTWLRLVIWLLIGLAIYFAYSRRHSLLSGHLLHEIQMPRDEETGSSLDPETVGQ
jgi:amino acid transporter